MENIRRIKKSIIMESLVRFLSVKINKLIKSSDGVNWSPAKTFATSSTNYCYHSFSGFKPTSTKRTKGRHKFGILYKLAKRNWFSKWRYPNCDGKAEFFIDDVCLAEAPNQFSSAAWFLVTGSGKFQSSFYIDDLRIRKYVYPEATTSIGLEISYEDFKS